MPDPGIDRPILVTQHGQERGADGPMKDREMALVGEVHLLLHPSLERSDPIVQDLHALSQSELEQFPHGVLEDLRDGPVQGMTVALAWDTFEPGPHQWGGQQTRSIPRSPCFHLDHAL